MDKKLVRSAKKSNRIQRLTEEQKKDPASVFNEFFDAFHLKDVRAEMWDWLCSALGNERSWHETGQARGNLLFLYENLEKLAEAAYIIHQDVQNKRSGKADK